MPPLRLEFFFFSNNIVYMYLSIKSSLFLANCADPYEMPCGISSGITQFVYVSDAGKECIRVYVPLH